MSGSYQPHLTSVNHYSWYGSCVLCLDYCPCEKWAVKTSQFAVSLTVEMPRLASMQICIIIIQILIFQHDSLI